MSHRIHISECEIVIGKGTIETDPIVSDRDRGRIAVLYQPGKPEEVARALLDRLPRANLFELPDGEAAKSLETAGLVYRWLNGIGMSRSDTVIGVGGGAATDLTGFVAGTYLRGIEAIYVPTTLLGAVDAAIGGKTGVNVDGKNLVGVFSHPSRVVIDTLLLAELPAPIARQGHAEIIKAGCIGSARILDLYETDGPLVDLNEVVLEAVRVKADVVSDDWKESGRRAILNYGHTVGHAVEIAGNLPHGDAVSIGMTVAAAISHEILGFEGSERQKTMLAAQDLPTQIPGLALKDLEELVVLDKKRDAGGLRMVLLRAFGDPVVIHVDPKLISTAMVAAGAVVQ
ncbi:MAG: 3-dehydroquinate synthase [Acidimicrobiia bacterium]|nr:3-dehydroquinate synthase [Acidimicrobiia bacterium]MBT8250375.1 3-dehydroquinate synthase [Acidimicrobiia bacterium]NND13682.1 3-dehydroquinate synthase [Acidimicrobiia bacterium]NNL28539.1 3-dehydroquinate synthase [Acidimicrobiia bacterium]NNL46742.1 3-dehydroquinate synthase [Acidimicrobiia bacterium]